MLFLLMAVGALALPVNAWSGEHAAVYKSLGDDLLRRGNAEAAIEHYQKAAALDPASTALYFNLAVAHYTGRDIPRATAALEKLVSLDPGDAEAQYNLACLYLYQRNTDAARRHFERAKTCCELKKDSFLGGLAVKNLEFINELGRLDPSAQGLFFLLLRNGLPPLSTQDR
ncbi:MAG: tetratricopeptide repeat protein [Candidatus Omnitrophica bacterium]|nr:tetratricopeptide repeat protein [Candidatus Omnitrophota bacterium]